jgi:hypothetical protein
MAVMKPIEFLPEFNQTQDLYKKVCEMMDYVIENHETESSPIINKYKDYFSLDEVYIRQLIAEKGYGYIVDAAILDTESLANIYSYLAIIHLLKGTETGLELVLKLLKYDYEQIVWWKKDPQGIPNTFDLNLNLDLTDFNSEKIFNLRKFTRFYVYPIMDLFLNLSFDMAALEITVAGFVEQDYSSLGYLAAFYINFAGFIDQEFGNIVAHALPATDRTETSFTANWTAYDNAIEYFLDVYTDPDDPEGSMIINNLNVGNVTSYPVTGLINPDSSYYYVVRVNLP